MDIIKYTSQQRLCYTEASAITINVAGIRKQMLPEAELMKHSPFPCQFSFGGSTQVCHEVHEHQQILAHSVYVEENE